MPVPAKKIYPAREISRRFSDETAARLESMQGRNRPGKRICDFVAPPLEGFWWQDGIDGVDYANKALYVLLKSDCPEYSEV